MSTDAVTTTTEPPLTLARRWGGAGRLSQVGTTPVHWVDFGGPKDRNSQAPPIVCVHGLGGSHLNWVQVAPDLTERHRVVAVDLAGFGLTPDEDAGASVHANALLLARFVDEVLGEPAVLMGNSMGGMVSLLLASRWPQLVRGLVLLDPAIPAYRRHLDRQVAATFMIYNIPVVGERVTRAVNDRRSDRQRVQATVDLCFADPSTADPDVLDAGVELAAHRRATVDQPERAYLAAARSLLGVLNARERYLGAIRDIDRPVLLVHGELDRLVPYRAAQQLAADNPAWTAVYLPGVGHTPQLEDPTLVVDAIRRWAADEGLDA